MKKLQLQAIYPIYDTGKSALKVVASTRLSDVDAKTKPDDMLRSRQLSPDGT